MIGSGETCNEPLMHYQGGWLPGQPNATLTLVTHQQYYDMILGTSSQHNGRGKRFAEPQGDGERSGGGRGAGGQNQQQ